jgi:hypothetical protein
MIPAGGAVSFIGCPPQPVLLNGAPTSASDKTVKLEA